MENTERKVLLRAEELRQHFPVKKWFFEKPASVQKGGFHAVAAKGADGSSALFVARYSDDNNVTDTATAYLRLPGLEDARRARCHVTDAVRTYTEVPLVRADDGSYIVRLQPNSFALVEW